MPAQFTKEDLICLAACHVAPAMIDRHGDTTAAKACAAFGIDLANKLEEHGIVVDSAKLRKAMADELLLRMNLDRRSRQQGSPDFGTLDENDPGVEVVTRPSDTEPAPAAHVGYAEHGPTPERVPVIFNGEIPDPFPAAAS